MNKGFAPLVVIAIVALVALFGLGSLGSGDGQTAGAWDSFTSWLSGGTKITGNGAPSGPHYNLNIIGVPKDKKADLTGSSGHRIFVPLNGKCRISLFPGDFRVLDANCTDGPSSFQLPNPDPDGDGITAYSVYARALGKPGGKATATSCVEDTVDGVTETWCSTESVALVRDSGRPTFMNVSKELLTICMDTDGDGICDTRKYLFADDMDYFWDYDNQGLRLAQLRFYAVPTEIGLTP